jgi:hypothetical protein
MRTHVPSADGTKTRGRTTASPTTIQSNGPSTLSNLNADIRRIILSMLSNKNLASMMQVSTGWQSFGKQAFHWTSKYPPLPRSVAEDMVAEVVNAFYDLAKGTEDEDDPDAEKDETYHEWVMHCLYDEPWTKDFLSSKGRLVTQSFVDTVVAENEALHIPFARYVAVVGQRSLNKILNHTPGFHKKLPEVEIVDKSTIKIFYKGREKVVPLVKHEAQPHKADEVWSDPPREMLEETVLATLGRKRRSAYTGKPYQAKLPIWVFCKVQPRTLQQVVGAAPKS